MKSLPSVIFIILCLSNINYSKASIFDDQENIHRLFLRQHNIEGQRIFSQIRLNSLIEEYTINNDSVGLFFCHLGISLANTDQDKVKMINNIIKAYSFMPYDKTSQLTPYLRLTEAISYYFLGKYNDSLDKITRLRSSFQSNEEQPEAMIVLFYNALCLSVLGDTDSAQDICNQARIEIGQMDHFNADITGILKLHLLNVQGLIFTFKNNVLEAEKCFKEGIEMAKKLEEGRYISNFYGNLSSIYILNDRFKEAIYNARLDYEYSLRKKDKRSQFALCGIFAEAFHGLNQPDSTKKYIDEMLKLLPNAYDSYFVENNRNFLMDYYIETNQPEKLVEATKYFNKILDSLTQIRVEKDYEMIRSQIDLETAQEQINQLKKINLLETEKNRAVRKYNIALTIGLISILLLIYIMYQNLLNKKRQNLLLENKNEEINHKNEELLTQKEDIERQSERISELNKLLEQKVDERTKEIVIKNKKLSDYAFYNSHHIRGPLARILGIINLWERNHILDDEKAAMLGKVEESAKELDEMVREVNKLLE